MKRIYITVSALLVASSTIQMTSALKSYLNNIPNGASFKQALGHPDNDESKFTEFATAFKVVDLTWTEKFCRADFPGAKMTNGEAFGDPCCTWKKGGTPDHTVTAFTTSPTTKTVCASAASPAPAATSAAPTKTMAPAPVSDKPIATVTPSTDVPATKIPTPSTAPATAKPSAGGNSSYTPGKVIPGKGGCTIKGKDKGKGEKDGKQNNDGKGGKDNNSSGGKGGKDHGSGGKGGKSGKDNSSGDKGDKGGKEPSAPPKTAAPMSGDEKQYAY